MGPVSSFIFNQEGYHFNSFSRSIQWQEKTFSCNPLPPKVWPDSGKRLWNNMLLSNFGSRFFRMNHRHFFPGDIYNSVSLRTWAQCLRVVWRGDPVVGQWIVHVLRAHLVQGRIPDGVLFREHICQKLWKERTLMILAVNQLLKKKNPTKNILSFL